MPVSKTRSNLSPTRQSDCHYCNTPLTDDKEVVIINGLPYHRVCANAKQRRKQYPETFRNLDNIRARVEALYHDEELVVKNSEKIHVIEDILKTFKKR